MNSVTEPVVSICIPTYNRARYLRCLLERFVTNIAALHYSYEILIADNASTDETEKVVADFTGKLKIGYFKREKNFGVYDNWALLRRKVSGQFQLYLADDDDLVFAQLNAILEQMLADPDTGIVYTPWRLYDRIEDKDLGNFYSLESDITIAQGDYPTLLGLILQHHIFPEHYVIRSDLLRAVSVFMHPIAYWAFVHSAEFLSTTKIAFRKEPFYISTTRYFDDETRSQQGHNEAQDGWDGYRGGLEYILSRIPMQTLNQQQYLTYLTEIQKFIAVRIHVGMKLRMAAGRNPIDTYYLACRLKGMGYESLIPIAFDDIRYHATVHFVLTGNNASDKFTQIICTAPLPEPFNTLLKARSGAPINVDTAYKAGKYQDVILIIPGSIKQSDIDPATLADNRIRLLGVEDLLRKFS